MDPKARIREYKETPRPMGVYRVRNTVNGKSLVVQIRSASRTGYSDLGVNRERVEAIRRAFATQPAPGGR